MDDILEDSFDQISSFNIIHRGIHARSATGTEIFKLKISGLSLIITFGLLDWIYSLILIVSSLDFPESSAEQALQITVADHRCRFFQT